MTLFGASWLCSRCGKDLCAQCYGELVEPEVRSRLQVLGVILIRS
jgi:hypothetical protein